MMKRKCRHCKKSYIKYMVNRIDGQIVPHYCESCWTGRKFRKKKKKQTKVKRRKRERLYHQSRWKRRTAEEREDYRTYMRNYMRRRKMKEPICHLMHTDNINLPLCNVRKNWGSPLAISDKEEDVDCKKCLKIINSWINEIVGGE